MSNTSTLSPEAKATEWVANMAARSAFYGSWNARCAFTAADLCGLCNGFGGEQRIADRARFVAAFDSALLAALGAAA